MREAHGRARKVLEDYCGRMDVMAHVLLARETVEGDVVNALLDGTWDEYLAAHPAEAKEEQAAEAGTVEPSAGAPEAGTGADTPSAGASEEETSND